MLYWHGKSRQMNCLSVMKTINLIISTLHEKLKDSLCGLVGERAIKIAVKIVELLLVRLFIF